LAVTLQDHARLAVFVDQTYQVEITSIEMTTNSGQQRVDLLNEGLGGFTPGSADVTLRLGFAVPVGGQEFPFQQRASDGDFVTMQVIVGGEQYSGLGKIMDVAISQSVNGNTEGTLTWLGQNDTLK
jgi:hypothetical protein